MTRFTLCSRIYFIALIAPISAFALQERSAQQNDPDYIKPEGNPWPPVVIDRLEPDLFLKGTPDERLPAQLRRDYAYPDPRLPFGYPQIRSSSDRDRYEYGVRQYGYRRAQPHSYDYGYSDYYRFPNYGTYPGRASRYHEFDLYGQGRFGYGYGGASPEEAYRSGVDHGRRIALFERQAELGLRSYLDAMEWGHAAFTAGEYGQAARHFVGAAKLNQGDPASRVCAANAMIALQQMEQASRLIERAFELQPGLEHLGIDLKADYASEEEFEDQRQRAMDYANANADNADAWIVVGYLNFFSGNLSDSAVAFDKASRLAPASKFASRMSGSTSIFLPGGR